MNEAFSVFSKFHVQRIYGSNAFFKDAMIYNVQLGVSLMDDTLFKYLRRQRDIYRANKIKRNEN